MGYKGNTSLLAAKIEYTVIAENTENEEDEKKLNGMTFLLELKRSKQEVEPLKCKNELL